jgi:hypothetical protein
MSAPDIFAFGGRQDDAVLLQAERELDVLASKSAALLLIENPPEVDSDGYPVGWQGLRDQITELDEMIAITPASTLAGAAVKLRRLLDPEVGIAGGNKDTDEPCLRQILATIEAI